MRFTPRPTRNQTYVFVAGILLLTIIVVGTVGFWYIGGKQHPIIDCLYMTVITIATIGFEEVIDLSGNPGGRLFTIFVAIAGIGILTYSVSSFTAHVVEGELRDAFRRRRVRKMIKNIRDHYIVCGKGRLGTKIIEHLRGSGRPHVIVDVGETDYGKPEEDAVFLHGDATSDEVLLQAGIERARGVFAATGDDNTNMVISLSARHLHPPIRIVARCEFPQNEEKMIKAGADAVISPTLIGGLRMATDMVKPAMASLLEKLLVDNFADVHVEELTLPRRVEGKTIGDLELCRYHGTVPLALKSRDEWVFPPSSETVIPTVSLLVVMTTTTDRESLLRDLSE